MHVEDAEISDLIAGDPAMSALIEKARASAARRDWVSIFEVAAGFGLSVRTLRRWQSNGMMPGRIRRGRQQVYRRADIVAWMAQRRFDRTSNPLLWRDP